MSLIRAYHRCAIALIVLGITSFATAASDQNQAAPLLALIGLPAALSAWWLSLKGRFLLPRWLVNSLLTLALVYAALRVLQGLRVEAVAELVVFIQVIKIGDRRSARDDAQILALSVFLAIAAMLTSNDFWVGLQIIALVPLLIATVMLFQIYSGWSAVGSASPVPPPAPTVGRPLRGAVAFATVGAGAMAVFIFILVPRGIGENALGNWRPIGQRTTTGFTDHVKLGSSSVINTSQKIVMEVQVRESAGPDEPPGVSLGTPDSIYYLRGAALETYRNGSWTADPGETSQTPSRMSIPPPFIRPIPLGSGARSSIEQVVSVRDMHENQAPLFSVWRPLQIDVGRGTRLLELDNRTKILRRSGAGGPVTYRVWSAVIEPIPTADRRTPASFDSAAIHDLTAGLLSKAGVSPDPDMRPITDDARAARLIESYLQHTFTYSLVELPTPEGQDPIENFLFNTKEGHCEYFASAMTAMCRSIGISARMITGYVAAEFNSATNQYVIRGANAHAWVEAEAGDGRWLRYDPTPPADLTRLHRPAPGLLGRLRRAVESAEYAWNSSVVSFDEGARQRLLGPDDDSRPGLLSRLDSVAERIRAAGPRHFLRSLMMGLAVFLAVAAAGLLLQGILALASQLRWWPRRWRWRGRPGTPARRSHARFYLRLLDLLARRGHAKPDWCPPLDHAGALAAIDPPLADATTQVSSLYYRLRFGRHELSRSEQAEAAAVLDRIARPASKR